MRTLFAFIYTSLDGYHAGPDGEFDWPIIDEDFHDFSIRQLNDIDTLVFGRTTYEHMAAYWPTPEAAAANPATAQRMNALRKVVCSSSLTEARWDNTELVSGAATERVAALKAESGSGDIAIFGSSTLTASLVDAGLVDELRIMVGPLLLGGGQPLLDGLDGKVGLTVTRTTAFRSGNVLIHATPDRPLAT